MEEVILALGDLEAERLRVPIGGELEPVAAALDRLAGEELLDSQRDLTFLKEPVFLALFTLAHFLPFLMLST